MQNRQGKGKRKDNAPEVNKAEEPKLKKLKIPAGATGADKDRKEETDKAEPVEGDKSSKIDTSMDTQPESKTIVKTLLLCNSCDTPCPPFIGYCYTCIRYTAPELLEENDKPRVVEVSNDKCEYEKHEEGSFDIDAVCTPIPATEFFARVLNALSRSVCRTTRFSVGEHKGEDKSVTVTPGAADIKILGGYVERIRRMLSKTDPGVQLELGVQRLQGEGDTFCFNYRWPQSPESAQHLRDSHLFVGADDWLQFHCAQDNPEDFRLPLGLGSFEVCWSFFGLPAQHLRTDGSFACSRMFRHCTTLLAAYTRRVDEIQSESFVAQLLEAAGDLDDTKLEAASVRMGAPMAKAKALQKAFLDNIAPVLEFCIFAVGCRSMPELMGDTPGHNMHGFVKAVIYNLSE